MSDQVTPSLWRYTLGIGLATKTKLWWLNSAAGKVTVGLALHWPCVINFNGYLWDQGIWKGRWAKWLCSNGV